MALMKIHSVPIFREIYSPIVHKATLFQVIFSISSVFIPFLIAYRSAGFWSSGSMIIEKPMINFLHQTYYEINTDNGGYLWSTSHKLNVKLVDGLLIPHMSVSEVDENFDGYNDKLNLLFRIPINETIKKLYIVMWFAFKLQKQAEYFQKIPIIVKYVPPKRMPGAKYSLLGHFSIYQREPLYAGHNYTQSNTLAIDLDQYDIQSESILNYLSKQNVKIQLQSDYHYWSPGYTSQTNPFIINITLFYKPVKVCVHPNFLQMLWYGWIQYLFILLPVLFVSDRIKYFVFEHNLFSGCMKKLDPLVSKIE